jgi:hypothetical protein
MSELPCANVETHDEAKSNSGYRPMVEAEVGKNLLSVRQVISSCRIVWKRPTFGRSMTSDCTYVSYIDFKYVLTSYVLSINNIVWRTHARGITIKSVVM